jgi:hypothetical protein
VENRYYTRQPRVGFALQLGSSGLTVLRGGAGVFYERVQGNDVYNAALNPPFAYQPSANNVYFSNPHTSALTGGTTTQSFPSTLTSIRYNYPPPGTMDFSLGIQRQLAPSVVAVVQYVGSVGWDQNDDRHINTPPLNDITDRQGEANGTLLAKRYRIYPGFSDAAQEENETNITYNALQTGLRIEARHGVPAQFTYTYSHEFDEVSGDLNALSDPFNAAYDLARTYAGLEATEAAMTSIDRLGFTLRLKTAEGMKGTRINFPCEVRTPQETRTVLVEMVRQSSAGKS